MRHLILRSLAGTVVLVFGLAANAQYRPRPVDQTAYQDENRDANFMFERIQRNLDRVQAGTLPFTAERSRVTRAREDLGEVQRTWNHGDVDRRVLNEAIGSIQRVVDMNRLSERNHDTLLADLEQLRDFRTSQGY
jgi:hypothetical protein